MLTTEGSSFAARSAKLSGAGRASTDRGRAAEAAIRNTATAPAAARRAKFEYRKGTGVDSSERRHTIVFMQLLKLCCELAPDIGRPDSRIRLIVPPTSSPHQPDEDNPGAGRGQPGQPQGLRRNGKST